MDAHIRALHQIYPLFYRGIPVFGTDSEYDRTMWAKGCASLLQEGAQRRRREGIKKLFLLIARHRKSELIHLYIKETLKYILPNIIYKEKE